MSLNKTKLYDHEKVNFNCFIDPAWHKFNKR